jgi:hypothetical protein
MRSPSPLLKRHIAEIPSEEISLKREAATRRLQTVWEDIIHRYSQYGGSEEDSDGGDVVDLETGTILVDHGHLRGLARTTGAVWGVPATPRETVFRGVAGLDEEEEESEEDYYKDEGDYDDLMGDWSQEPPSSDVSESEGDETSRQLSQNVRTLTTKLRTAPHNDQFNLALDYDALLLPPVSSSPPSTLSERRSVHNHVSSSSDSDELRFIQQFQNGCATSKSLSFSHSFFAADRDAARLCSLFMFRNGATTGPI